MEERTSGPLSAGSQLGPYRLGEQLGTGGMGTVYAADVEDRVPGLATGTRVALKLVHAHLLETPGFFKRFLREADVGKSIQHPSVVQTYEADALIHAGVHHHFLVMEYVEGQTLRDLIAELDRVPEELCRHIGREVAGALAAIHDAGVVHRDIKPENVLITPDNTIKVMDLGVARLQDEVVRLSQTGAFVGSIHYASPEQFGGEGKPDHRADLHALGLLLYELGCGQHPYYDEDFRKTLNRLLHEAPRRLSEINPQLSPFFEELVHTLIAKSADDRFATAAEVVALLEEGEDSEWWKERAKSLRVETKQPLRRIRIPRETALYGRDAEIAQLRSIYADAKVGNGQIVLVEGEAGIGKTRLVDEFVGQLQQAGEELNFLFGTYPPGGTASAGGAFSTAFREHLGPEGSGPWLTDTPLMVPAFDALLRGDATPVGAEPLTTESMATCFVHTLRALAADRVTILLIDDLQFAPKDARNLFSAMGLAAPGHRVLLVGTVRPGVSQDWQANLTRLEHAHHLNLPRLGPKDLVHLLKDCFRSERLAQELGLQIAVKSDGNPFFAFEIIRGLRDGRYITQSDDGSWSRTQVIDRIAIPSTVMDLIEARIADLSEDERDILDVAACCGFEFDPGVVATAAGLDLVPTLKRLGRIEKTHRVIRSAGRHCRFDHYQIQEVLYEGILEQLREHYHASVAAAIEAREKINGRDASELDGALCVELCEHHLKSADASGALRYLDAALDYLNAGYLHDAAADLAGRALAVPDLLDGEQRIDALLRRAARLHTLVRRDEERAVLEEGVRLADAGGDPSRRARALRQWGSCVASTGDSAQAIASHERAVALALDSGDRALQAQAMGSLGSVLTDINRYADAKVHHERQLDIARELGDLREEASASGSLGRVAWRLGSYDESRACHLRELKIAEQLGDRGLELSALGGLGVLCLSLGLYDESRQHKLRQIEIARDIGNRASEANGTGNLGEEFRAIGDYDGAQKQYERAAELARELGLLLTGAVSDVNLGETFAVVGAYDRAREHFDACIAVCADIDRRDMAALARADLGLLAAEAGEFDVAEQLACEGLAVMREIHSRPGVAELLGHLGAVLLDAGRPADAKPVLEESLELGRELDQPNEIVLAACLLADTPGGDVQQALDVLREHGARAWHVKRMRARYHVWRASGDRTQLSEAHRELLHLRDHAPEDCRESVMQNVALHRAILAAVAGESS